MYDEQHSNSNYKQNIANILAHEIAHMWFGNLVSFDWWDTVWLKEGFARYYQYFLAEMVSKIVEIIFFSYSGKKLLYILI